MPSPFPGMDPYLENPTIWPDVHLNMISEMQATLNPILGSGYVARAEARVYISDDDDPGRKALIPDIRIEETNDAPTEGQQVSTLTIAEPVLFALLDDEIEERYLTIKHVDSDSIVTIIELLRPSNKIRGSRGRKSFMAKRHEVLESEVNWVEIDLLRDGARSVGDPPLKPSDYRVIVSRGTDRFNARCWPIGVRQHLPVIGIPLRGKDPEVPLDLGAVLGRVYERAAFQRTIDYRKPPVPPLNGNDVAWAKLILRQP